MNGINCGDTIEEAHRLFHPALVLHSNNGHIKSNSGYTSVTQYILTCVLLYFVLFDQRSLNNLSL